MLKRLIMGGIVIGCVVALGVGSSYALNFTSATGSLTLSPTGSPSLTIRTSPNVYVGYESTTDGVTYTIQSKHLQGNRRFAAEAEQQNIFYQSATPGQQGMASIGATTGNDITGWSTLGS